MKLNTRAAEHGRRALIFIVAAGLLLRLLTLPWVQVAYADAVARIFIAWNGHPLFYLKSSWGPLHFLMMDALLRVWHDPIYAPILLHVVFSVATAIPLYAFVKREWNEVSARFVAAASLLYPIAYRYGYLALSEIPFVFFAMCSLNSISRGRKEDASAAADALLAGILLTISCMLRMEGWALIPFFAYLLRRNTKSLFAFLVCAMIFPAISMVASYFSTGEVLAGVSAARHWQIAVEGVNENLNTAVILNRLVYFPLILFFGLTPLLFICCAAGIFRVLKNRKPQREYTVPFFALLLMLMYQAARGFLLTEGRYSLILGYLMLPFAAEVVEAFRFSRRFALGAALVLLSILPFSYSRVVLARIAGPTFPNPIPADLEVIPKVSRTAAKVAKLYSQIPEEQRRGMILDFFGWKDTNYVALMSKLYPTDICPMPGGKYQALQPQNVSAFLQTHPTGILIRTDDSPHIKMENQSASFEGVPQVLKLHEIAKVENISLYRYSVLPDL